MSSNTFEPAVLNQLREEVGDDTGAFAKMLISKFSAQAGRLLAELEQATGLDDAQGVQMAAHHLRGSCATLGALRLGELCAELEEGEERPRTSTRWSRRSEKSCVWSTSPLASYS